jgi:hypothetical protein
MTEYMAEGSLLLDPLAAAKASSPVGRYFSMDHLGKE